MQLKRAKVSIQDICNLFSICFRFKLDMAVVIGQGAEVVVDLGTGVGVDWR